MARNIPALLLAHLKGRVTTCCFCLKVVRQDGVTFGFTDHDSSVQFGGQNYQAATASFTASAIQDQIGLAVSNLDVMAAFVSSAVTSDDLEAGRYDEAAFTVYLVNYLFPDAQNCIIRMGTVGQVQAGDLAFQAEVRGLMQSFSQFIGALCSQTCRVPNLGDTGSGLEGGCNFVMPAPFSGPITIVDNRANFQLSIAGSFPDGTKGSLSGGYFAFGLATALSGKNINLSQEIFASDESLNFTLMLPFPWDLNVGDVIQVQIGCDMSSEVCRLNYNNLNNFRGEPYVPGTDQVFQVNGE